MSEKIYLSIVIPAFREEGRVHKILDAVLKFEKSRDYQIETIVVADGSPDHTADAARKYDDRLSHLKVMEGKDNKGKGGAVQEGMLAASGEYIVFADADNSTPIEQVEKLLKYVPKYEVVIGSRYSSDGRLAIPQSFVRRLGSRGLNFIIQMLAVYGIKDTQCGFKLFSNKAAQEIFSRQTITDFSFDIEILAIARKLGYKIKEAGIIWYDDPHSTVSPIKDGIKAVKAAWKVRQNLVAGKYE